MAFLRSLADGDYSSLCLLFMLYNGFRCQKKRQRNLYALFESAAGNGYMSCFQNCCSGVECVNAEPVACLDVCYFLRCLASGKPDEGIRIHMYLYVFSVCIFNGYD